MNFSRVFSISMKNFHSRACSLGFNAAKRYQNRQFNRYLSSSRRKVTKANEEQLARGYQRPLPLTMPKEHPLHWKKGVPILLFMTVSLYAYLLYLMEPTEDDLALEKVENQSNITDRYFLDVSFPNQIEIERVIIGLYADSCPKAVQNFKSLCNGHNLPDNTRIGYAGCLFYRSIPGVAMETGDVTKNDGTGGRSVFPEETFPDENLHLKHIGVGVVSMVSEGVDTNRSRFRICLGPVPELDGKQVVIGKVLRGARTLKKIASFGSPSGAIADKIMIVKCGDALPDHVRNAPLVRLTRYLKSKGYFTDSNW